MKNGTIKQSFRQMLRTKCGQVYKVLGKPGIMKHRGNCWCHFLKQIHMQLLVIWPQQWQQKETNTGYIYEKILQKFNLHSPGTSLLLWALAPISGDRKLFDSFSQWWNFFFLSSSRHESVLRGYRDRMIGREECKF